MKHLLILRLMVALAVALYPAAGQTAAPIREPSMIPQPAKVQIIEGTFELASDTFVTAQGEAENEARKLAAALRVPTGFGLPINDMRSSASVIDLRLDPSLNELLGNEGYRISVTSNRVVIRAAAPAGLFYGGITFRQLLPTQVFATNRMSRPTGGWRIACIEIEDRPRFAWRGLLLDPARHFLPPEFIKKFLDVMALHKLNRLQMHLTDDQGWRIEIRKHPRLTHIGSIRKESPKRGDRKQGDRTPYGPFFFTQDQIRQLVAYAQALHITIVPEIEMPGHFLSALAAYPELSCTGGPFEVRTRWGVEPDILCAGNDRAVALAQEVLAEICDLFPSPFIHIGGDEAPRDRWNECPKCQARIKAESLKNAAELQTSFNNQIEQFLLGKGRRLIGWDEILEGGLTPGAAVMSWRGVAGGIAAAQAGHDVVMSPTSHCYFDYGQSKGPGEPESIGGFIPLETVYAFDPVPEKLFEPMRKHVLGAQGNLWGEFFWTSRDVEYFAYPRAAALAEVVWSAPSTRNYENFLRRLGTHVQRLNELGVNYRRLEGLTVKTTVNR